MEWQIHHSNEALNPWRIGSLIEASQEVCIRVLIRYTDTRRLPITNVNLMRQKIGLKMTERHQLIGSAKLQPAKLHFPQLKKNIAS